MGHIRYVPLAGENSDETIKEIQNLDPASTGSYSGQ